MKHRYIHMLGRLKIHKLGLLAFAIILLYITLPLFLPHHGSHPSIPSTEQVDSRDQTEQSDSYELNFRFGKKAGNSSNSPDTEEVPTYREGSRTLRLLSALMQHLLNMYRL